MTDAGGFPLHDDVSLSGERERLLRQIAEALDLPVSAFSRRLGGTAGTQGPTAAECAAMLAAFSRIRDPHLRGQCLKMLERCAEA